VAACDRARLSLRLNLRLSLRLRLRLRLRPSLRLAARVGHTNPAVYQAVSFGVLISTLFFSFFPCRFDKHEKREKENK